jgi:hypothetical protein
VGSPFDLHWRETFVSGPSMEPERKLVHGQFSRNTPSMSSMAIHPAEALGGRVLTRKLIGCLSFFLNLAKRPGSTN